MSNEPAKTDKSEFGPETNFIRDIVIADLESGKHTTVVTRFPPEPNGYLHIGHSKSICLNFGLAREFGGVTHLRFDDTNPETEEEGYVRAIKDDIRWLGFDWGDRLHHASDYFDIYYEWAVHLVKEGKAYVCDLSDEEIREFRGTVTSAGKNSPYRDRSVEENLDLLERMRNGEFPDGSKTLRARIDMASKNMKMRDPLIYRIRHKEHHQTGNTWPIYPLYDYAHCLGDAIEGITHSICTLEFDNNRELYDWFITNTPVPSIPRQYEFARLNLTYTVMSKRKLLTLVKDSHVSGWDDPRMPTLSGLRRRGYPPAAIRKFCDHIGVAKRDSVIDLALLEHFIREDLNKNSPRYMAVLRPLKIVIENYPDDLVEEMDAVNNPEDPEAGTRKVPFSKTIYIERNDFMEDPPKKFFRMAPGREVRLRYAYFITCTDVIKDDDGHITELRCTYDPDTRGGDAPDGRKVKATLHWVSVEHSAVAEVRLYENLFLSENPLAHESGDFTKDINPNSLEVLTDCRIEPALIDTKAGDKVQFERLGYFCKDADSTVADQVFNRTVTLKDAWARILKNQPQPKKGK